MMKIGKSTRLQGQYLLEHLANTNPTESASAFRITALAHEGDSLRVTGPGKTNAPSETTAVSRRIFSMSARRRISHHVIIAFDWSRNVCTTDRTGSNMSELREGESLGRTLEKKTLALAA